eukprot:COSAG02_NODE_4_length_69935_cov_46.806590_14_plen_97_part_00
MRARLAVDRRPVEFDFHCIGNCRVCIVDLIFEYDARDPLKRLDVICGQRKVFKIHESGVVVATTRPLRRSQRALPATKGDRLFVGNTYRRSGSYRR